ncbi:TetR/AcrR family transcriptional regulator [Streptomyces sp. NPDC050433]|uniref:TetR/AcrR family transcriptional regulator n=1 Tax=unclassified Streptomyces TaxID=2593676 RepID=UPI003434F5FB
MESAADQPNEKAKQPLRTSVWLEGKPAARGRRSDRSDHPNGLDRDRIIAVSVRLLDAEGPAKFSMRRLAAELGVTAMSLYWYVDTKDDLLELALDSVFTEVAPGERGDDDPATDWRDDLRALAVSYRTLLVRHPWVSPLLGKFLNIGPHSTEFSAAVRQVVRRTGLPAHGQMGALSTVFQFVYGLGTIEGRFEQAEELMEAGGGETVETVEEMRERDFTFALEVLIAGIEAMRARG